MKVLLIADIGRTNDGFYHVGDEAMFYETAMWYKKNRPHYEMGALSRSISHKDLGISEYLHLPFPVNGWHARVYLAKLIVKSLFWKLLRVGLNNEQLQFINTITRFDTIHFSGGGNFYSICVSWLYYAFYIIFLGKLLNKKIILTSQTIGPFWGIDKLIAPIFLNLPNLIAVREPLKNNTLKNMGVYIPKSVSMIDAAYTLPSTPVYKLSHVKRLRIGLSLHWWKGVDHKIQDIVSNSLNKLSESHKLEVILIPHIIQTDDKGWDVLYMENLLPKLNKSIHVISTKHKDLSKKGHEPASVVKYLTSCVDLLITSRYHELIFALSQNVPCIAFTMGEYYKSKNQKAMMFWYKNNYSKYLVDLDHEEIYISLYTKAKTILNKKSAENRILIRANRNLFKRNGAHDLAKVIQLAGL